VQIYPPSPFAIRLIQALLMGYDRERMRLRSGRSEISPPGPGSYRCRRWSLDNLLLCLVSPVAIDQCERRWFRRRRCLFGREWLDVLMRSRQRACTGDLGRDFRCTYERTHALLRRGSSIRRGDRETGNRQSSMSYCMHGSGSIIEVMFPSN
jgi:hypothetical protein